MGKEHGISNSTKLDVNANETSQPNHVRTQHRPTQSSQSSLSSNDLRTVESSEIGGGNNYHIRYVYCGPQLRNLPVRIYGEEDTRDYATLIRQAKKNYKTKEKMRKKINKRRAEKHKSTSQSTNVTVNTPGVSLEKITEIINSAIDARLPIVNPSVVAPLNSTLAGEETVVMDESDANASTNDVDVEMTKDVGNSSNKVN